MIGIGATYSQGIMAPGGTGAWGNMVYMGAAYAYPKPYTNSSMSLRQRSEGSLSFGFGFGDPVSGIGVQVGSGILEATTFDIYNLGAKFHRYFGRGISAAFAVENLVTLNESNHPSTAKNTNEYFALTKDFSYTAPSGGALSRLSLSLGGGVGRFSKLPEIDTATHKGNKGTYAFGALRYNLFKGVSLHAEWTGVNANAGLSFSGRILKIPVSILVCAADLTKYSGDGIRVMVAGGIVYQFKGKSAANENKTQLINQMITQNMIQNNVAAVKDSLNQQISELERQVTELKEFKNQQQQINQDVNSIQRNVNELKTNVEKLETNQQTQEMEQGSNQKYNAKNQTGAKNKKTKSQNREINLRSDDVVKVDSIGNEYYELSNGMYVVIYAFKYKENALKAVAMEKEKGVDVTIGYNKTKEIFYLYTAKFSNLKDARKHRLEEIERGFENAWIHIY
jgi:hypothetical protein